MSILDLVTAARTVLDWLLCQRAEVSNYFYIFKSNVINLSDPTTMFENTYLCMACHLISRLKSLLDDQQRPLATQLELRAIRQHLKILDDQLCDS